MKLISLVIPTFNEESNIDRLYKEVTHVMGQVPSYTYEFVFINDGSSDGSWNKIITYAHQDNRVKAINFSRNFGHQIALTAGYDYAKGDVIISMDADLQDPPTLLLEMIQQWEKGADIVYARRVNRDDGFLKKVTAYGYYKILESISDVSIPRNVGDFRLIDKKVLTVIQSCRERSRYLRGMVAWTGFNYSYVDFIRPNRTHGTTGYTWKKMLKLGFDGMTSFSLFPLKIAAYIGCFVIMTGCAMFAYITLDTMMHDVYYPLFKWLVTIIYIFMGVQFILLWLIGEYIGRIFEEQKERPLYITNEKVNI